MNDEKEKNINEDNGETNSVLSPWAARFFDEVAVSDINDEQKTPSVDNEKDAAEETVTTERTEQAENVSENQEINPEETEPDSKTEVEKKSENDKFKLNFLALFLAFAVVIVVSVFVTFFVARNMYKKENKVYASSSVCFDDKDLDKNKVLKFQEILDFIRQNYYKDYDINDMIEGAIEGMVASIDDPYGGYYVPGDMENYTSFVEGSYVGIGFSVTACDKGLLVSEVYGGSPAEKAGIEAGDIITHINGKVTKDITSEELSSMMGAEGSEVSLKGMKGDGSAIDVKVTVEKIIRESVVYKELDGQIKYILIKQFITGTSKEFKEAVDKAAKSGTKGIIIDLRNNPGGYANEAEAVADIILPEGTIATSRDRNGNVLTEIKSDKNEITVPVVLLVNQNSASSSELVTGAFRDMKKGEIVGVHTYGKALSQINKVFEADGSGIVLSYSRYFTPSGECIDGVGIEPTVVVELPEELKNIDVSLIPEGQDLQLEKAIEIIKGGND